MVLIRVIEQRQTFGAPMSRSIMVDRKETSVGNAIAVNSGLRLGLRDRVGLGLRSPVLASWE